MSIPPNIKAIFSLAVAAILIGGSPVFAQDIEAGKKTYKKLCRACHGPTAKGLASYPKLTGQTAEYLADKLERYRAGEKFGPNTMLMAPNARKLSDEDIINISNYIAEKLNK